MTDTISPSAAIGDQERRRIVALGRSPRAPRQPVATIQELFVDVVRTSPDSVAVSGLTYARLDERARTIAAAVVELGVRPGDLVGVCLPRSPELIPVLLGVLLAGGAYVPMEPSYPAARLAFVAEDAGLAVVLADDSVADRFGGTRVVPFGTLTALADRLPAGEFSAPDRHPDDPAYVIYTSGSTGRPKGAVVPHRAVAALLAAGRGLFDLGGADVWTWFHSVAFDFSVWEIFGCLLTGGRLVVVPEPVRRSPEDFHRLLIHERVTVLNQTPSAFTQLIAVDRTAPTPIAPRLVITGGERLHTASLGPWFDRHPEPDCRLVNMFGITETTVHVTAETITGEHVRTGSASVGRAIPGWSVRIVDTDQQVVPIGAVGEIAVGGDGLALRYLNRPDLTEARFVIDALTGERLYLSGDRGRMLPDGAIEHLGRLDAQVKIRGHRIEPDEIRTALLADDSVVDAAVVARASADTSSDTDAAPLLVGYVVFGADLCGGTAELRRRIAGVLPDYLMPDVLTALPALPLTTNGKLDTDRLPAPVTEKAEQTGTAAGDEPRDRIRAAWISALGHEDFTDEDSFFTIGGNSLKAIRVMRKVSEIAGFRLPVRVFFDHQSLADLTAAVRHAIAARTGAQEEAE